MDRVILHVDANCFYASVEMFRNPSLRGRAMCVGGDEEARHGIVLTKSPLAKKAGVKTGETLAQARKKCPDLIVVPPNYKDYLSFSRDMRAIYCSYTDQVEPFGLDEAWLDVTNSDLAVVNDPLLIAEEISERIKFELGITVSIGVSWNKPFAKLGSDIDSGDGIIVITRDNYKEIVWPRPVSDLINVGSATTRKLYSSNIKTIGDLACASNYLLDHRFGVIGQRLKIEARGEDISLVKRIDPKALDTTRSIKSIGNGLTAPHDITNVTDAKALLYRLSESVGQRLRELHLRGKVVSIGVRHNNLYSYTRQVSLSYPTCITTEIMYASFKLLKQNEPLDESSPIRALYVRMGELSDDSAPYQNDLFGDQERRKCLERLDFTIDSLRSRFGNNCIQRLAELQDPTLNGLDIKQDNIIHPVSYWG